MSTPVVAVHGGAWAVPERLWDASIKGVKEAAVKAYKIVEGGGSSLDAAQTAVESLEDDPAFDAGTGSVLTYDELVEADSIIMDGSTLRVGAVAAIRNMRNPVKVARLVMDKTNHVVLAGEGSNKFASDHGLDQVDPDSLITEHAREELRHYKKYNKAVNSLFNNKGCELGHDTVGCVAIDKQGHLAAATSTGGITAKMPGRVGDTPVVGAGGYADDKWGAISTTGHGESITKVCLAHRIIMLMSFGSSLSNAADSSLSYMKERVGGYGGCVGVSKSGDIIAKFTTDRMPWAFIKDGSIHWGIHPGEEFVEKC